MSVEILLPSVSGGCAPHEPVSVCRSAVLCKFSIVELKVTTYKVTTYKPDHAHLPLLLYNSKGTTNQTLSERVRGTMRGGGRCYTFSQQGCTVVQGCIYPGPNVFETNCPLYLHNLEQT